MTTEPQVRHAADVFIENDVYNLDRYHCDATTRISAIAWLWHDSPALAHANGYAEAWSVVSRMLPGRELWLMVSQGAVQPDSVMSRNHKLWDMLAMQGIEVPAGTRTSEVGLREDGGIRWFGAIQINNEETVKAAALIEQEGGSFLISTPAQARIADFISSGWQLSPHARPPERVLRWVVNGESLLFWPVGQFDDPESGVVIVGPSDIVKRITRTLKLQDTGN